MSTILASAPAVSTPTTQLHSPEESPFFPTPSTTRPAPTPITEDSQPSSDSSIETVASLASASSSYSTSSSSFDSFGSSANGRKQSPYSTLVIEDHTPSSIHTSLSEGMLGLGLGVDEGRSSRSAPTSRRGSNVDVNSPSSSTAPPRPAYADSFSGTPEASPALSASSTTSASTGLSMTSPSSSTSEPSPSTSPSGYFRSSLPPLNTSSAPSTRPSTASAAMGRSTSNTSLTSPTSASIRSPVVPTSSRPGSAGTFSTTSSNRSSAFSTLSSASASGSGISSTRSWVRDGEASDSCSLGSSKGIKSGGTRWEKEGRLQVEGRTIQEENVEGEVYKVASDGMEFLDPRPEPAGAKLSLNRDDPAYLILRIVLPGFSLDNITVAMRRGHKVHIVADSYGEQGGHFEKLVSLGSDVQSSAPRAEFNGTELRVYIKRRHPSSHSNSPAPLQRTASSSSPANGKGKAVDTKEAPVVTRSTGPIEPQARACGKALCGPEGAKAAAKKAKEEAAMRAKEQAKALPKPTRRLPFAGKKATSPAAMESVPVPSTSTSASSVPPVPLPSKDDEQGTIGRATKLTLTVPDAAPANVVLGSTMTRTRSKSKSHSLPDPPHSANSIASTITDHSSSSGSSSGSDRTHTDSTAPASASYFDQPVPPISSNSSSPSSPARPKFESNITLRPSGSTFVEAAAAFAKDDDGRSSSGGVTPKVEKKAFSFSPFGRSN